MNEYYTHNTKNEKKNKMKMKRGKKKIIKIADREP